MGEEQSVLISNQHFHDINPLVCGEEYCRPGHRFGPASRSYLLLHYVVSGCGVFTSGGREWPVNPGQCFVIRPFEITTYQADNKDPWHYIWIGFECQAPLPPALQQGYVIDAAPFAPLFPAMLSCRRLPRGREGFLCGKIWELFTALDTQEDSRPAAPGDYVRLAKNCFESEYMSGITVGEVARRLGLDRSYFSTLFKKEMGVPPQQYLNELRLRQAMDLLQNYGYAPGMAARSTGYADVFAFSRMFKRRFGAPPSAFRSSP